MRKLAAFASLLLAGCLHCRRRLAAIPRQSTTDRRGRQHGARHAEAAVDLRGRRRDSIVGRHRRWRSLCGRGVRRPAGASTSPPASCAGNITRRMVSTNRRRWSHEGVVYVGDIAGTLHAVRVADGKALWTFKTSSEIRSSPVVSGDRLFIGSYDGNLYCLSVKDGKVLWKFTTSSYVHATPAIAGGLVYIAGCDEIFRGLRIADGKGDVSLRFRRIYRRIARDVGPMGLFRHI